MIVRDHEGHFLLIRQHDHGLVSGCFAEHWAEEFHPREETIYAIRSHDLAWEALDQTIRWNTAEERPYAFTDYPAAEKLAAYKRGIDRIEQADPYAACLCSMHYTSFIDGRSDALGQRFAVAEFRRQVRLQKEMPPDHSGHLERNFRLLQVCDDLSLFVCLNKPGRTDHPWYQDGFSLGSYRFHPVWRDTHTLTFRPNPLAASFPIRIPCWLTGKDGQVKKRDDIAIRVTAG